MSFDISDWGGDRIDSRDIEERLEELEGEAEGALLCSHCEELEEDHGEEPEEAPGLDGILDRASAPEACPGFIPAGMNEEDAAELVCVREICEEGRGLSSDWTHGEGLILESDFTDYAQELADDIGATPSDEWPHRHIDWEAAAEELKQDYSELTHDGITYLVRSC